MKISNKNRDGNEGHAERDPRRHIIQVADSLFLKKGVSATNMAEIMKASATKPGQFCYFFRGKRVLFQAVLQTSVESVVLGNGDMNLDLKSWTDVEQCLLRLISFQRKSRMTRRCPLGSVGSEVGEGDELIRQDVGVFFEAKAGRLAKFFRGQKHKGRLSRKANATAMTEFLVAAVQGAMLIGKINRDGGRVKGVFRETLLHLRSYGANAQTPNA